MLEARNLAKRYGAVEVFAGVSLGLQPRESVALVGPSGAGKSTLLHLLGTLDTPDAGELWFEGSCLNGLPPRALAAFRSRHLGFVFQFHHLLVDFSALENVALPARLAGISKTLATDRAAALLDTVGLSHRKTHRPTELSGGEQQRVAIARALVRNPKLLLADEPTGNLDETNTQRLFELLQEQAHAAGAALLVATHNRTAAAQLDRVLELSAGAIRTLAPLPSAP